MFQPSVKVSKELLARIKDCVQRSGHSSVEEFVEHALDKELRQLEDAESDEALLKKMRGLGYID